MKKLLALALAALMIFSACAALSSCGSDENVIIVGYTIYAPMNYKDDDGKLVGFDTELAQKVFENLGYKVEFQEIKWENKYTDLNAGTIDCIWNGFTCNTSDDDGTARADKVDFSYRYMENKQVVVVKKGGDVASADDLASKLVAVEKGSAGESFAEDCFADANVKGYTKQTDCLFEVNAGTADAAVLDEQLAKSYVGKGDYTDLVILDDLSGDLEYYAVGFKKGSDLTAKVNAEFEKLAEDGTIRSLGEKYHVANAVVTDFSNQK